MIHVRLLEERGDLGGALSPPPGLVVLPSKIIALQKGRHMIESVKLNEIKEKR